MMRKPEMTSKERMLTAFRNKEPDMVPVAPDISNMIPVRLIRGPFPFRRVYLLNRPPLWRAYIAAVKHFGMDGWFTHGKLDFKTKDRGIFNVKVAKRTTLLRLITRRQIVIHAVCRTPAGDLSIEVTFPAKDPPRVTKKFVEDFKKDFAKLKYLIPDVTGYDDTLFRRQMKEMGDLGAVGIPIELPGFQSYMDYFSDLKTLALGYREQYDLFKELIELHEKSIKRRAEMILDAKPDFLHIGASGLWLQGQKVFRDFSLPTLKMVTRMAKEAGIPSVLHACGKSRKLVEICANETDLNAINPLERPPEGDCDLEEIKKKFDKKIALMGNLHTTDTMLLGKPEDIEREAKWCIDVAAEGGGFVLSTGDQCPRDTPDENIFTLVRTAREYGRYPLKKL